MGSDGRHTVFGYGLLVIPEVMKVRAPKASRICSARLDGFRWFITSSGYASTVEDPHAAVFGVLWSITRRDEYELDLAEGVSIGAYVKRSRGVITACGKVVSAMTYEVPSIETGHRPQRGYVEAIVEALASDQFVPVGYIEELLKWVR